MNELNGKTLLITGGSRGIGEVIGLRAARDGANVVIAAKTTEAHPKLPGTILTAAETVRALGGKALAVPMDIRNEAQVRRAVDIAVGRSRPMPWCRKSSGANLWRHFSSPCR